MKLNPVHLLLAAAALGAAPLAAQSPAQVQSALQQPGAAEAIRAKIGASGLTPDQMRALRLDSAPNPALAVDTGLVATREVPHSNVFGVDVFRRTTTQFLPLTSGPVPPDYRLGPGDQLVLILTGDVELTHQLPITREGFVLIPQVGQVFLANLTLDQAKSLLYDRLGRVYSGV